MAADHSAEYACEADGFLASGVVLLKVHFNSMKAPEPRLIQVLPELALIGRPTEYMIPPERRPIQSRKALASSTMPCFIVSHPTNSWWRSAVGIGKLKVFPFSCISGFQLGHESPVFQKVLKSGMILPPTNCCFTVVTHYRSIDFICDSEAECSKTVEALSETLRRFVSPMFLPSTLPASSPKSTSTIDVTYLEDPKPNNVVFDSSAVDVRAPAANRKQGSRQNAPASPGTKDTWTDDERATYLVGNVFQHIDADSVTDFVLCLEDGCPMETRHLTLGLTPLLYACKVGAARITRYLLKRGAQFDPVNDAEDTAFHVAVKWQQDACIDEMFRVSENSAGHTELILNMTNSEGDTPLHVACKCGHLDLVARLARKSIVPLLYPNNKQQTPLVALAACVAEKGIKAFDADLLRDTVHLLLDLGADETVDWTDHKQYTCLHYFIQSKCVDICRLLLQTGADPKCGVPPAIRLAQELSKSRDGDDIVLLLQEYIVRSDDITSPPLGLHKKHEITPAKRALLSPMSPYWKSPFSPSATLIAEQCIEKQSHNTGDNVGVMNQALLQKLYDFVQSGAAVPWKLHLDEQHNCHYFFNERTGEASWEPTEDLLANLKLKVDDEYAEQPIMSRLNEQVLDAGAAPVVRAAVKLDTAKLGEGRTPIVLPSTSSDAAKETLFVDSSSAQGGDVEIAASPHQPRVTFARKPKVPPPPPGGPMSPSTQHHEEDSSSVTNSAIDKDAKASVTPPKPSAIDLSLVERYEKMGKLGIPTQAVLHKMQVDGVAALIVDEVIKRLEAAKSATVAARIEEDKEVAGGASATTSVDTMHTAQAEIASNPKFTKFVAMKKHGVPLGAIRVQMNAEGLTKEDIEQFLRANASVGALEAMGLLSPTKIQAPGSNAPLAPGFATPTPVMRTTLKLHWDPLKLPEEKLKNTIWGRLSGVNSGEISQDQNLRTDDVELLTSIFATKPTTSTKAPRTTSKAASSEHQVGTLLELKRANNLNIALSQFKKFASYTDIASSVYRLDARRLPRDLLDKLARVMPTADEQKILRAYKQSRENLMECDKFFFTVLAIPRFPVKVAAFITYLSLRDICDDIEGRAALIRTACSAVLESEQLTLVLGSVLTIGNVLNQGHSHLAASAISLDSLLKLSDTKGADKKTTLMDALAMVMCRKVGTPILAITEEFSCLNTAKRVELPDVKNDLRQLGLALEAVKKETQLERKDMANDQQDGERRRGPTVAPPTQPAPALGGDARAAMLSQLMAKRAATAGSGDPTPVSAVRTAQREVNPCSLADRAAFCDKLDDFTGEASELVRRVQELLTNVEELAKSTVAYFGEDPANVPVSKVFSVLQDFIQRFATASAKHLRSGTV